METNEETYSGNQPDLSNLRKLSGGDKEFELQYINSFLDSSSNQVIIIQQALLESNASMLAVTLHLMKPQLQFYGLISAFEYARQAEEQLNQNPGIGPLVKKYIEFILKEITFAGTEFQEIKSRFY